jgi:ribonuclease HI
MNKTLPEFLLFVVAESNDEIGHWHFSLESESGEKKISATEMEPGETQGRLELLAAIRGLEALDQPSRVLLVTTSAYIRRGIRFGLREWRNAGWRWERFGHMVPVTNADLWQRLDQALQYHEVTCRRWRTERVDNAHVLRGPHPRRHVIRTLRTGRVQKQAS